MANFSQGELVGEFTHNGKKYDIYRTFYNDKDLQRGWLRALLPKGKKPEDLGGLHIISTCDERREKTVSACFRKFRDTLDELADRPARREESDSMY